MAVTEDDVVALEAVLLLAQRYMDHESSDDYADEVEDDRDIVKGAKDLLAKMEAELPPVTAFRLDLNTPSLTEGFA